MKVGIGSIVRNKLSTFIGIVVAYKGKGWAEQYKVCRIGHPPLHPEDDGIRFWHFEDTVVISESR